MPVRVTSSGSSVAGSTAIEALALDHSPNGPRNHVACVLAPLEPGVGAAAAHDFVRTLSPRLVDDRPLSAEIEAVAGAIRDGSAIAAVEAEVGALR